MTTQSTHSRRLQRVSALTGMLLVASMMGIPAPAAAVDGPLTIVSLTFDDSNADQMAAVEAMNSAGLSGTFYTVSGNIDAPGYFTRAQLKSIRAAGHEIGGHTVSHRSQTTTIEETTQEVCQDRATLSRWGFEVTSFAYPFSAVNKQVTTAVMNCNYNSARGLGDIKSPSSCADCPVVESIPPGAPFLTKAPDQVDSTWTFDDLTTAVANAETTGGWLQLTFHHICTGCGPLGVSPVLFAQFAEWLAARPLTNNTVVQTVDEVIGGPVKPVIPVYNAPAPGPGVNGLVNPGLEKNGTGNIPTCWMPAGFGNNTATFARVAPGHTGHTAELVVVTDHVDGDARLMTTMDILGCTPTVTPGHTYSLRGWYKATAPTQFAVYLRQASGLWKYWTSSPYFPARPGYTEAVWTSPAVPAGTTGMSFGLSLFQNGTLMTDDYALYDTAGAPAASARQ